MNKSHLYYPDFYIPKYNLIIEIKSSWTIITDKNMILKEYATIQNGFRYLRIIDNDFEVFKNYLISIPDTHGY